MPDERELVRSRIDLVELVSERVKLTRIGSKWKGLCPFHTEKTPSFHVNADLQLFHCFGCKKGGDLFDWVMLSEGVDFRAALELLAERAGVSLTRSKGDATRDENLFAVMEAALEFYRAELGKSREALAYIATRGIDDETVSAWELGFAPDNEIALANHFRQKGIRLQDAKDLSLLSGDSGGYYDFFRGRLMFPIRDERGRLLAFSGRSIDGSEPKYINSRDTVLFKKSETLFGLLQSRDSVRASRSILLVEGQMDVLACHMAGLRTAVAALGTALTASHCKRMHRYCDEVVVMYDADSAGRRAAERACVLLREAEVSARAVLLDVGADPDSLRISKGAEALRQAVENAASPTRFLIAGLLRDFDAKPGIANTEFWSAAISILATEAEQLEVDALLDQLAPLHPNARVDRKAAMAALRADVARASKTRHRATRKAVANVEGGDTLPMPRAPEAAVLRGAIDEGLRATAWPFLSEEDLIVSVGGRGLADALLAISQECPEGEPRALVAQLDDSSRNVLLLLESPIDIFADGPAPVNEQVLESSVARLRSEREKRERLRRMADTPTIDTALELYKRQ
jgi:DNA primase